MAHDFTHPQPTIPPLIALENFTSLAAGRSNSGVTRPTIKSLKATSRGRGRGSRAGLGAPTRPESSNAPAQEATRSRGRGRGLGERRGRGRGRGGGRGSVVTAAVKGGASRGPAKRRKVGDGKVANYARSLLHMQEALEGTNISLVYPRV